MTTRGDHNRPLKEWLQVFVQSPQLRDKLYQKRIEKIWADHMGPVISGYTRKIKLENATLVLQVTSAPLKSELTIMREQIITIFNEKMGEEVIKEVRII